MSSSAARQAAELLVNARRTHQPIAALPATLRPADSTAAFAIQDEVTALLGESAGGWKVGLAPNAPPSCAPMYAPLLHASPHTMPAAEVPMLAVEGEIAVRIGRDLPPRSRPYDRAEVIDAIDAVCPAIEVVHSRLQNYLKQPADDRLADCGGNAGFIYGPLLKDWRRLDLAKLRVRFEVGGKLLVDKVGGCPSEDPLVAVVWLANHLTGRCGGLKAGHMVTTGSCVGMPIAKPGDTVRVVFDQLGEAQVTFTA